MVSARGRVLLVGGSSGVTRWARGRLIRTLACQDVDKKRIGRSWSSLRWCHASNAHHVMSEEFVKRKPLSAQAHAPVSLILR